MTLADDWNEAAAQLTAPGAPFAWSVRDINGVPMRVFDNAPDSLRDLFTGTAAYKDADYLVFGDERLSYSEVHRQVKALAAWLAGTAGVGRSDRVAISMRNYPEWIVAYWAAVSMGAVVVGMNAWWTATEMAYGLDDSDPAVLVVDGERWERLRTLDSLPDIPVIVTRHGGALPDGALPDGALPDGALPDGALPDGALPDGALPDGALPDGALPDGALPDGVTRWAETVADPDPQDTPAVALEPDDDLCVFYTSGTTGFPKGAVMTHRAAVHNVMNMGFYSAALGRLNQKGPAPRNRNIARMQDPHGTAGPNEKEAVTRNRRDQPAGLVCVPLFHVTGCNCYMHPTTVVGGKLVLMYRWDATEALRLIDAERPSTLAAVPAMSREIVLHPDFDRYDTSSLGSLGGGGSPLHPDLVDRISRTIPSGNPGTGYGLTETSGVVTMNIGRIYRDKPTTVGRPLPTVEARVVDNLGVELPPGRPGELLVRSPIVIRGYLNKPEATAETIIGGWLHTGDIATIDEDGFISIVDRAKDLVIRGGENIACAEVENAIYQHDAVEEAIVFAVPDERLGEVPGAAVVLRAGADLDGGDLRAHLLERLAAFKVPAHIWFLETPLPRNASGKYLKRQVRDQLLAP
ncbi:AMP-binding protein [Candidatus Poriferisocius sp.]|uniref:class I adenylate-forming enzyme family protein n=1 Tax=Candidatus Poriferisocius sp. TaxID=3101276 RepID=UPI003B01E121